MGKGNIIQTPAGNGHIEGASRKKGKEKDVKGIRNAKNGDRVMLGMHSTHRFYHHVTSDGQGKITASWPVEVECGTVVGTIRSHFRTLLVKVQPDEPGYGVFFIAPGELRRVK